MKRIDHALACMLFATAAAPALAQHDMMQHDVMQHGGMVMNANADMLPRDCERISRTPGITPTASSIGRVTNCSTVSGAASGFSV